MINGGEQMSELQDDKNLKIDTTLQVSNLPDPLMMNQRKNYSMISKGNNLVTARYSLTGLEQKLLYKIFEEVQQYEYTDSLITFKVSDLYTSYKDVIQSNITKKEFQQLLHNIQKKDVYIIGNNGYVKTQWFAVIATNDLMHYQIDIDKYVFPYIKTLKTCFTPLKSASVYSFSRFYTMRFYELIKKWFPKKKDIEYTLDDLKNMLDLNIKIEIVNGKEKKVNATYANNANFERRIIKKSIEEINEKSELTVTYEMIKKKRKYHSVIFHVKEKEVVSEQTIDETQNIPTPIMKPHEFEINGVRNDELMSVLSEEVKEQFLKDFDKIDFTQPDMIKLFKNSYEEYVQTMKTSEISIHDLTYTQFMIIFRSKQNNYIMDTTT